MSAPATNPQELLVQALAEREHATREQSARGRVSVEAARIALRAVQAAALAGDAICRAAVAEILALDWPTPPDLSAVRTPALDHTPLSCSQT